MRTTPLKRGFHPLASADPVGQKNDLSFSWHLIVSQE